MLNPITKGRIEDPFELLKRLPPELRREVIEYCVPGVGFWGRWVYYTSFEEWKRPYVPPELVPQFLQPFSEDSDLQKLALDAWYRQAKFTLDETSFEKFS